MEKVIVSFDTLFSLPYALESGLQKHSELQNISVEQLYLKTAQINKEVLEAIQFAEFLNKSVSIVSNDTHAPLVRQLLEQNGLNTPVITTLLGSESTFFINHATQQIKKENNSNLEFLYEDPVSQYVRLNPRSSAFLSKFGEDLEVQVLVGLMALQASQ